MEPGGVSIEHVGGRGNGSAGGGGSVWELLTLDAGVIVEQSTAVKQSTKEIEGRRAESAGVESPVGGTKETKGTRAELAGMESPVGGTIEACGLGGETAFVAILCIWLILTHRERLYPCHLRYGLLLVSNQQS
jgi:hypothetical protein